MSAAPKLVVTEEGTERGPTCGDRGGKTKKGTPCSAFRNLDPVSGLCMWHDESRGPEREANQRAAQAGSEAKVRATARPKGLPPPPQTIEDARAYASWCVDAVARGPADGGIDVRRAHEITGLLREFRGAAEKAELVGRVKALEAELRKYQKKQHRRGGGTRGA